MSLKNRPYIALYVQDVITDEKLLQCSASTQGVYFRLICVLHKSEDYGTFLLKQKQKQNTNQIINFATALVPFLAFDLHTITSALTELIEEKVIYIDGDLMWQKRMVKDARLSENRAKAGQKGGKNTQQKNTKFAKAKSKANTQANSEYEYEYEYEIEDDNEIKKGVQGEKIENVQTPGMASLVSASNSDNNPISDDPEYFFTPSTDQWRIEQIFMKNHLEWNEAEIIYEQFRQKRIKTGEQLTNRQMWAAFEGYCATYAQNERKRTKTDHNGHKPQSNREKLMKSIIHK